MRRTLLALAATTALACGPSSDGEVVAEGDEWIETGPAGPPGERPGFGDDEDDDDDDDEDDDDDDDEGFVAFWGIFGGFDGAQQLEDPEGEYFAEEGEQVLCAMLFAAEVTGPADDCSECTAAWEITLSEPEVEDEGEGGCAEHGPGDVDGLVLRLGITEDEELLRDEGDGWRVIGEAFAEDGELILEWEHELE